MEYLLLALFHILRIVIPIAISPLSVFIQCFVHTSGIHLEFVHLPDESREIGQELLIGDLAYHKKIRRLAVQPFYCLCRYSIEMAEFLLSYAFLTASHSTVMREIECPT